jgi:hypothetical protein
LIKKIVLIVAVLLCFCSVNVLALTVDNDFYVYGEDNKELCGIIGMSETELDEYCKENNITFLAIDRNNQRQIRKSEITDAFSLKIGDFLALSEDEIVELTEELTGFTGAKGTVIEKGDKRFLQIKVKTTDSGGDYILTQYVTVANSKKEVISFYTSEGVSVDYIERVFSSQFKLSGREKALKTVSAIGTVLFSALALVVTASIIKDTFVKKPTE